MKNEKEIFIGELKHHINSSASTTKPKRTKRLARLIGAGGGLTGLAKGILVMTVTAALISTMVGTYLVSQSDNIELVGRLSYDLWIDDAPIGGSSLVMTPDTFTGDNLSWGEVESFVHTFWSPPNNGNFSVVINQSWQTWLLPGHEADEFYGYRMYCLDETDTEITSFIVLTGEPEREIKFCHSLDVHFAATSNPLPYNLTLEVSEYNAAPVANDLSKNIGTSQTVNIPLSELGIDGDAGPDPLSIVSVTFISGNTHCAAAVVGDEIVLTADGAWTGPNAIFDFVITDGDKSDTGRLTAVFG